MLAIFLVLFEILCHDTCNKLRCKKPKIVAITWNSCISLEQNGIGVFQAACSRFIDRCLRRELYETSRNKIAIEDGTGLLIDGHRI